MRIGLMIGPEKGRYDEKVARLISAAQTAEREGFSSIWVPQVPNDFDGLTAIAAHGSGDRARRARHRGQMPIQTRHPIAMAQQALSNQAVCEGRFTLGLGPSHHWIVEDMLGLSYERPAHQVRTYLEVLNAALAGPGPVDVENDTYRVHNPLDVTDIPTSILLAALAPVMLRIAGEHASGTILWMADERRRSAITSSRVSPRRQPARAGRPRASSRGVPVVLCRNDEVDDARCMGEPRPRTRRVLAELRTPARARRRDRCR